MGNKNMSHGRPEQAKPLPSGAGKEERRKGEAGEWRDRDTRERQASESRSSEASRRSGGESTRDERKNRQERPGRGSSH